MACTLSVFFESFLSILDHKGILALDLYTHAASQN